MTPRDTGTPTKRRKIVKHVGHGKNKSQPKEQATAKHEFTISTASLQLTRDADVKFYTGFDSTNHFEAIFLHLSQKLRQSSIGVDLNKQMLKPLHDIILI